MIAALWWSGWISWRLAGWGRRRWIASLIYWRLWCNLGQKLLAVSWLLPTWSPRRWRTGWGGRSEGWRTRWMRSKSPRLLSPLGVLRHPATKRCSWCSLRGLQPVMLAMRETYFDLANLKLTGLGFYGGPIKNHKTTINYHAMYFNQKYSLICFWSSGLSFCSLPTWFQAGARVKMCLGRAKASTSYHSRRRILSLTLQRVQGIQFQTKWFPFGIFAGTY